VFLDILYNYLEVMLSDAANNVGKEGRITKEKTRQLIRQLLEAPAAWLIKLQTSR
jgi:hypothetical protein